MSGRAGLNGVAKEDAVRAASFMARAWTMVPSCLVGGCRAHKRVRFPEYPPPQSRESDQRCEQKLLALSRRQQAHDVPMQQKLLVPRDAGDQMVFPVARGAPGAGSDHHPPEAQTEAARPVQVVEGHEVVFGELTQPVEIERKVGNQEQYQQRKSESPGPEGEVSVDSVIGESGEHGDDAALGVIGRAVNN